MLTYHLKAYISRYHEPMNKDTGNESDFMQQLASLWDDSGDLSSLNMASTHKRSWHCKVCGQHYEATANTMRRAWRNTGNACPSCAGLVLVPGYNDLATVHPQVAAKTATNVDPKTILASKKTPIWFMCSNGHRFQARIAQMLDSYDCPVCKAGGYASEHEDIMRDWDWKGNEDDPHTITCGSSKMEHWMCASCGHKWKASVYARVKLHRGCPSCMSKGERISDSARRTYASRNPFSACPAAKFWDAGKNDIPLSMQSAGSPDKRWFRCERGHSTLKSVREVARNGFSCDLCVDDPVSGHDGLMRFWDDDRDPSLTSMSYSRKLSWKCPDCGSVFLSKSATLEHLSVNGEKVCPVCGLRTLVKGVNDFATRQPGLAAQLQDPGSACTFMENDTRQREWVCADHPEHVYSTTARQRMHGVGCKICTAERRGRDRRLSNLADTPITGWIREYADEESGRIIDEGRVSAGDCRTIISITYPDCGHERRTSVYNMISSPACPLCACGQKTSAGQESVFDYVKSILPEQERGGVKYNWVLGDGDRHEVDIFVPSRGFAIEYNGLYWHDENHVDKDYAHDKWAACMSKGIHLLTVWEDDWMERRPVVEDMIRAKLGLVEGGRTYARSCRVEFCGSSAIRGFLKAHHIQGAADGSVCSRLVDGNDDTVAAMVCSISNAGQRMTIDRYASSGLVPGGFSRLLAHSVQKAHPCEVVTFSDNACSDGALYEKTGFRMDKELPPDYMYVVGGERRHKFGYRKHRFMTDPELKYEQGLTEHDLATLNGLARIYDAGKKRWVLSIR